jgi:hypothetical protein
MKFTQLPDADQILGVQLHQNRTAESSSVEVQYRNAAKGIQSVRMPFLDALFLLNALEQMSLDSGWDSRRRPPTA